MDGVGLVPISLIAAKRQRRPATHAHTHTYVCSEGVSRHEGLTYQHAKPRQHTHKPNHKHKPPRSSSPPFIPAPPEVYRALSVSALSPAEREGGGCVLGASAGPALRASAAGAAEGITKASPTTSEATAATSATIIVASFILPLSLSHSVSQSTPCVQIALCAARGADQKTGGTIFITWHRYMRASTDKIGVPPFG